METIPEEKYRTAARQAEIPVAVDALVNPAYADRIPSVVTSVGMKPAWVSARTIVADVAVETMVGLAETLLTGAQPAKIPAAADAHVNPAYADKIPSVVTIFGMNCA